MQILTPEQVIAYYPSVLCIKTASTWIKVIDERDMQKETSFVDLEGRVHEIRVGRCICVGLQGERWTCSIESLERDRYPVSDANAEGYRQYRMRYPLPVSCFDIPFPFLLQWAGGSWQCDDTNGGIITWNGKTGDDLDMRVIVRSVFMQTYSQI